MGRGAFLLFQLYHSLFPSFSLILFPRLCLLFFPLLRVLQYSFLEIDYEIFSMVILTLPLIQEGQLSVSDKGMCSILVNRLLNLDLILKERNLHKNGHVEHSSGAVKTAFDLQVDGKPGRPKTTWKQLTERDCREWKLTAINPHDRHTWRSGVRSAIRCCKPAIWKGAH